MLLLARPTLPRQQASPGSSVIEPANTLSECCFVRLIVGMHHIELTAAASAEGKSRSCAFFFVDVKREFIVLWQR